MRKALSAPHARASIVLGIGLLVLWHRFGGGSARNRLEQVTFALSGYLRPRPDPAMEAMLRTAFTELDLELAAILDDPVPPSPGRVAS